MMAPSSPCRQSRYRVCRPGFAGIVWIERDFGDLYEIRLAAPHRDRAAAQHFRGEADALVPGLAAIARDLHVVGDDVGGDHVCPVRRVHAVDRVLIELGESLTLGSHARETHDIAVVVDRRRRARGWQSQVGTRPI